MYRQCRPSNLFSITACLNLQNKGQPSEEQQRKCVQPASVPVQSPAVLPASVTAGQCQVQPASPLIQEIPETGLQGLVDHGRPEAFLLQEAGTADTQMGQQDIELNDNERHAFYRFDKRLQALEASSRRTERKIDQILECCRTMAQAMSPA